jgi:leucyl/phenylalanyl-tRNA---protein transferase
VAKVPCTKVGWPRGGSREACFYAGAMQEAITQALDLYRQGWFPMHDHDRGVTEWVQPTMRALIPLDERFRVPRSTRQAKVRGRFVVTVDQAFAQVIGECWQRDRDGSWLHEDIVALFLALHEAGIAHSVEAWVPASEGQERVLVGGLYGLALGNVFAGESMFSKPEAGGTEASKVCLVHLVELLRARGFVALDSQLHNPHLEQFGLYEVPREEYVAMLAEQVVRGERWGGGELL